MRAILTSLSFTVALLTGCAGTTNQGTVNTAASVALITANVSESAWLAYDTEREIAIAKAASSRDDYETKLAAWHLKVAKVDRAFAVYFKAVAVALQLKDNHSIAAIAVAALQVEQVIADVKKGEATK